MYESFLRIDSLQISFDDIWIVIIEAFMRGHILKIRFSEICFCGILKSISWYLCTNHFRASISKVLCPAVPYHSVQYCTVPRHEVPHHTVPYRFVPYRAIPYRTVPYCTVPYHTIPYHTMLYCVRILRLSTPSIPKRTMAYI